MKSEHRHDLQTNDLSKLTKKAIEGTEKHGLKIAAVVCIIAIAVMGVRIYRSSVSQTEQNAWYAFSSASSADSYAQVADNPDNKGTSAADWALLMEAETRSSQAIQDMFTDRENALSALNQASEDFQKLIAHPHPMIKQRAIFGLGLTQESMGHLDAATTEYEKLANGDFELSVYQEQAKQRLDKLKQAGSQAFYAWFMKQNPKPPEPPKPKDTAELPVWFRRYHQSIFRSIR